MGRPPLPIAKEAIKEYGVAIIDQTDGGLEQFYTFW